MTQLPEVEVVRKDLEREIVGKKIKSVEVKTASLVAHHRNRPELYRALEGRKIEAVGRRGTALLLDLDDDTSFVIVCGSGARLTRETAKARGAKSTQLILWFSTGGALHYHDTAKDGKLFVAHDVDLSSYEELAPGGIDPLADQFTWQAFSRKLVECARPLRSVLTDETVLVGLGDVYADEVLWSAGLSGGRQSDSLSAQEFRRLYRSVLEVVYEAVKQGAAEIDEDEEHEDEEEAGSSFINVHGRKGEPCPRCRTPLEYADVGGGKGYLCPQCQT